MINAHGQDLNEELLNDKIWSSHTRWFYIDPNQFDGNDNVSELAANDDHVDSQFADLEYLKDHAHRIANMVGHRVLIEEIVETGLYGRSYETAYTAFARG